MRMRDGASAVVDAFLDHLIRMPAVRAMELALDNLEAANVEEQGELARKLQRDTGGGCSICRAVPVVNIDGTYWLCGPCVAERMFPAWLKMPKDYTPGDHGHRIESGHHAFTIAVAERDAWYILTVPAFELPEPGRAAIAMAWSGVARDMLTELRQDYAPGALNDLDGVKAVRKLRADRDALGTAAAAIRDAYPTDPGTSDLDNEQPIHITTTLGAWRKLDRALNGGAPRPLQPSTVDALGMNIAELEEHVRTVSQINGQNVITLRATALLHIIQQARAIKPGAP